MSPVARDLWNQVTKSRQRDQQALAQIEAARAIGGDHALLRLGRGACASRPAATTMLSRARGRSSAGRAGRPPNVAPLCRRDGSRSPHARRARRSEGRARTGARGGERARLERLSPIPEGAAWDPPRLGGDRNGATDRREESLGQELAHPGELSAWPVQEKSRETITASTGASAAGLVTRSCWGAERNATGLISGVCARFGFMGTVSRSLLGARIVGRTLPPGREPLPRMPASHRSVPPWAARDPPLALGKTSDPRSTSGRNECDGRSGCRCWQPR
jgi:hypothetical protein